MSGNPQDFYEVGYESAKQRFAVEYAKWLGKATVLILGLMMYIFLKALDEQTLVMFAKVFFSILLALIGFGGSLLLVVAFMHIRKPGRQLPGKFGEWEGRLGME
jgi:hypothetical protein